MIGIIEDNIKEEQNKGIYNLPKDWEVKKLSEIANVKGGKRLPKGYNLTNEPNGFPYIRVADMHMGGVALEGIQYVPEEISGTISNYRIYSGDLFISVAGTLGIVGEVPKELSGANLTENADKICDIKINKNYLKYFLTSSLIQVIIENEKTQNAQPKLALTRIKNFNITIPTDTEQQKIAEILSTVDEQIENTEQLIEKTKELKRGLMQRLLTKGIGHTKFKQTDLGEIPEAWEVIEFKELTTVLKCGVASTPVYVDNGIPFLSSQNVKENRIILDKYNFISKDYHKELTKKVTPMNGDILYTRVGANFGKAAVVNLDFNFSVYVSLTLIRLNSGLSPEFYSYVLNSEKYQKIAKSKVFQGGGVPNLNVKEVEKFLMIVPSLEEQQEIASILSTIDEQIESYEKEKEMYIELKKGLMQQLLTGKIRVSV